ncbi:MAG: hypothetical protein PHP92_03445 [Candidatus Nanoarchaeia archaeon]|nr:hypothetical protein [Candidatus Nanoarchaeia archaeon]
MEILKEKVKIYKLKEEWIEEPIYKTRDGMKYNKEDKAKEHEEYLDKVDKLNKKYKLKKIKLDEYGVDSCAYWGWAWFIVEMNDETKKDLEFFHPYLGCNPRKIDEIKLGWNILYEECYGDSGSDFFVTPLSHIIDQHKVVLNKLESLYNGKDFSDKFIKEIDNYYKE